MKEQIVNTVRRRGAPIPGAEAVSLKPLKQGCLDSLCGLYSVVNAIRWATHPTLTIGTVRSKELIDALAGALDKKFGEVFEVGTNDLRPILRAADVWLKDTYGLTLTYIRPFRRSHAPTAQDVEHSAARHLATQGNAIVAATPTHWSVVRQVTPRRLMLFDSTSRTYFRMPQNKERSDIGSIVSHRLFLISVRRK